MLKKIDWYKMISIIISIIALIISILSYITRNDTLIENLSYDANMVEYRFVFF